MGSLSSFKGRWFFKCSSNIRNVRFLVIFWVDVVQIAEVMVAASPAGSTGSAFHAIALFPLLGCDCARVALLALRVNLQEAILPASFSLTGLVLATRSVGSFLQAFTV